MSKFIEEIECYFVKGLECKFPIDESTLKADMADRGPNDVHSYRPFEYSVTCTNCLLSMILACARDYDLEFVWGPPK